MIPANLAANPLLSHWISVRPDGTVEVRCGKVELGQGILSALAQIVADELDVAYDRIRMVPLTTDSSPDEALTAGSRSIEDSGAALRQVGAEVRAVFLAAASKLEIIGAPLLFQPSGWTLSPGPGGNGAYRHRNGSGGGGSARGRPSRWPGRSRRPCGWCGDPENAARRWGMGDGMSA